MEGRKENVVTDYILKILGLDICADTMVGNEMIRGEMLVGPAKALFMPYVPRDAEVDQDGDSPINRLEARQRESGCQKPRYRGVLSQTPWQYRECSNSRRHSCTSGAGASGARTVRMPP
ncbi:hypothetical protein Sjap_018324 [Stephania japonica]|uniref:Uncharacterized protein n=1 Tax=Stephania japonica TaxID=461633 RepID=A0AAP0I7S4_9MAGN